MNYLIMYTVVVELNSIDIDNDNNIYDIDV